MLSRVALEGVGKTKLCVAVCSKSKNETKKMKKKTDLFFQSHVRELSPTSIFGTDVDADIREGKIPVSIYQLKKLLATKTCNGGKIFYSLTIKLYRPKLHQ